MKKSILFILAAFSLSVTSCKAQSILDVLKNVQSSKSTEQTDDNKSTSNTTNSLLSGLGNLVAGLLGTDKVNENSIIGTWTYDQPAVVFESENILTNVGAMAASTAVEEKLQTYLDKVGFTKGKMTINFKEDKTGSVTYNNKTIPFQWSVAETELTINLGNSTQNQLTSLTNLGKYTSFKINCKLGLGSMQLSFKADKMAQFISKVLSVAGQSSSNTTLSTIATAASKIDGMYLGLTFTK